LYEYLDLVTDLDNTFEIAYAHGALLLPLANKSDKAIQLLQKGQKAMPESWRMLWQQAFIEYYYLSNAEKAISLYEQCSKMPECPSGALTVANALKRGESRYVIAKNEWSRVFHDKNSSESEKDLAALKFNEMINLIILNKLKREYVEKYGRMPDSLDDIKKEFPETKDDIFVSQFEGVEFLVDKENGYIRASNE
jgi:tetratricopeptide (TPR) repeat protein